jgi:outer membrane protein assembly factor BamB
VDADHVYAVQWDGAKQVLYAYTHDGKPVWSHDFGTFTAQHGAGASPIPFGGKVYFNNDIDGKAELFCLDGKFGFIRLSLASGCVWMGTVLSARGPGEIFLGQPGCGLLSIHDPGSASGFVELGAQRRQSDGFTIHQLFQRPSE